MNVQREEYKFQMLKLVKSGRTMGEARAMIKAVSVGLTPEYAKQRDIIDLLALEGGLWKLTSTRADHISLWKVKMTPRKLLPSSKEETIAKFATPYKGKLPLNWKRDGNLIRRGPPNRPKPGSSRGKIGRTRVRNAKKVLRELDAMVKEIQKLQQYDSKYRKKHGLDKFVKSIKAEATIK